MQERTQTPSPSIAEVRAADGVVAPDFFRRAADDDAAGLNQIGVVGEIEREVGVLLDDAAC